MTTNYRFIEASEIKRFNLELTSKCALACLRCPRTMFKGEYKICDMSLLSIKKLFSSSYLKTIDKVYLVGNNGDPILNAEFHEIVDYFNSSMRKFTLSLHTSGYGRRSEDWWLKTSSLFKKNDSIIFSIDGIEDTNHIYRVGSKWNEIEKSFKIVARNCKANIVWKFNIFKHNQHQIYEAARLAKLWRANSFQAIKSDKYGADYNLEDKNMWNDPLLPDECYVTSEDNQLPVEWDGSYANFDRVSFKFSN